MEKSIQFRVEKAEEGGYIASGVGVPIFTQAESLDELLHNIQEAVELHFEGEDIVGAKPSLIFNFKKLLPNFSF